VTAAHGTYAKGRIALFYYDTAKFIQYSNLITQIRFNSLFGLLQPLRSPPFYFVQFSLGHTGPETPVKIYHENASDPRHATMDYSRLFSISWSKARGEANLISLLAL